MKQMSYYMDKITEVEKSKEEKVMDRISLVGLSILFIPVLGFVLLKTTGMVLANIKGIDASEDFKYCIQGIKDKDVVKSIEREGISIEFTAEFAQKMKDCEEKRQIKNGGTSKLIVY